MTDINTNLLVISHRGNISGKNTAVAGENSLASAIYVKALGFNVEIDLVSSTSEKLYTGHDTAQELFYPGAWDKIRDQVWLHCKDLGSLALVHKQYHYFSHNHDDVAITSKGYIWVHPRIVPIMNKWNNIPFRAIAVLPEQVLSSTEELSSNWYGVCTDYPLDYLKLVCDI
jgi:hypothetical protein